MKTIENIKTQMDFPAQDLMVSNADILGLVLCRRETLDTEHSTAELYYPSFYDTHLALARAADTFYTLDAPTDAVDYGIRVFEALHTCVSAAKYDANKGLLRKNIATLAEWQDDERIREYLDEAYGEFERTSPLTKRVIEEASSRYFSGKERFAVSGAAWARQIERIKI